MNNFDILKNIMFDKRIESEEIDWKSFIEFLENKKLLLLFYDKIKNRKLQ